MDNSLNPWVIYTAIIATIGIAVPIILHYLNKPRVMVKVFSGTKFWRLPKEYVYIRVSNKLRYPIKLTNIVFKGQDKSYGYTIEIEENPSEPKTPKIDVDNPSWDFCLDLDENATYTFTIKMSGIKSGKIESGIEEDVQYVCVVDYNRNEYVAKIPHRIKGVINK